MTPYYQQDGIAIFNGCATSLPLEDESVQMCVTSPPYFGLRDYGVEGQIGLEKTPDEYVAKLVTVFREVRRVLKDDGTLWVNLGDSYANDGKWGGHTGGKHVAALHCSPIGRNKRYTGLKPKDLIGVPWMVAFALRADGWWLRQDIVWEKPNPMPESVTDRCTKAHEYLFLLAKSERYFFDAKAIAEDSVDPESLNGRRASGYSSAFLDSGGDIARTRNGFGKIEPGKIYEKRNRRSVWTVPTNPYPGTHFATFPPDLIEPCILAGSRPDDTVLDPFSGSGTTGAVCRKWGRRYVGVEINPAYIDLSAERFRQGELFPPKEVA